MTKVYKFTSSVESTKQKNHFLKDVENTVGVHQGLSEPEFTVTYFIILGNLLGTPLTYFQELRNTTRNKRMGYNMDIMR